MIRDLYAGAVLSAGLLAVVFAVLWPLGYLAHIVWDILRAGWGAW